MNVKGKPHPNCVLSTSCSDSNLVMLALKPRRVESDWESLHQRVKNRLNRK